MSKEVDQMTLDLTSKVEQIDELYAIIRERDATIAALLAVPDEDDMRLWPIVRTIRARMAAVVEGER
jgi:hypothetical protein